MTQSSLQSVGKPVGRLTGSMTRRPAACLFDLDGLLLDTEPLHGRGWSEAAKHFGADLNQHQLKQLKGRRREDCAAQVDAWLPKPVGIEAVLAVQQPIVRALLPGAKPMPWAQELVEHCDAADIPMALVTSSSREAVRCKAEPHPWLNCIKQRIYGDDPELSKGKPDPAPFRIAAQRLAVDPTNCWAMEDSQAGTQSALGAGCLVWVLDPAHGQNESVGNPRRISALRIVLNCLLNTGD